MVPARSLAQFSAPFGLAVSPDDARLAVADMYITACADVVTGTLSSNWCRTADALRRAAGRGRVPYVTPEKALYYSVCPNVEDTAPDHGKHVVDWPATTAALRRATESSWK